MALRGRRTRTVLMADRLMFCRSREYSTILKEEERRRGTQREMRQRLEVRQEIITTPAGPEIAAPAHPFQEAQRLNAGTAALARRCGDEVTKA